MPLLLAKGRAAQPAKGAILLSVYIEEPRFLPAGESCLVVEFADEIDRGANDAVTRLKSALETETGLKLKECLPTYRSLSIYFDPLEETMERIIEESKKVLGHAAEGGEQPHMEISIPVCYGGEYGPDIKNVAENAKISEEEVIERHTANVCHCYMIGFIPGFAYLGGMDESIATPRLANPRTVIPGGSVGIAGKQTGIYPLDSPGGWQLIGRTPLRLFTPEAKNPTLIQAGYGVKFVSVSEEEYKKIEAQVADGTYKPQLTEVK